MIAMRVMTPADEDRLRFNRIYALDDSTDSCLSVGSAARNKPVREAEKQKIFRSDPELSTGVLRFLLPQRLQPRRGIGDAIGMRARPVADKDNGDARPSSAGLRDQPPQAKLSSSG